MDQRVWLFTNLSLLANKYLTYLLGMMPVTSILGSRGKARGSKDISSFLGSEMYSRSFSIYGRKHQWTIRNMHHKCSYIGIGSGPSTLFGLGSRICLTLLDKF